MALSISLPGHMDTFFSFGVGLIVGLIGRHQRGRRRRRHGGAGMPPSLSSGHRRADRAVTPTSRYASRMVHFTLSDGGVREVAFPVLMRAYARSYARGYIKYDDVDYNILYIEGFACAAADGEAVLAWARTALSLSDIAGEARLVEKGDRRLAAYTAIDEPVGIEPVGIKPVGIKPVGIKPVAVELCA